MRFIHPLTNFSSGELSENLFGRIDVQEYQSGLSKTTNCLLNPQGGAYKRFGSKLKQGAGENSADTDAINILEFVLEDGTSILLEFAAGNTAGFTFRILTFGINASLVEVPYTANISIPLTGLNNLYGWNGAAIGKKIYLANYTGSVPPIIIDFTDYSNIIVDWYPTSSFAAVPFLDTNADSNKAMRITNANTQGPYTVEANFNAFVPGHVGMQLMLTGLAESNQAVDDAGGRYNFERVVSMTHVITGYNSPTSVTVQAFYVYDYGSVLANTLGWPIAATSTTEWFDEWRFSAWGVPVGYPKVFSVFEGRLIASKEDKIYASSVTSPIRFQATRFPMPNTHSITLQVTVGADRIIDFNWQWNIYNGDIQVTDPYNFTIASKDGAPITWVEASRFGVVGTYNKQYFLDGDGSIVSQLNVGIRPFSTKSSFPLLAVAMDNTVFYTDGTRTKVYMYLYNEANGSYISKEVTLLYGKFSKDNFITVMRYSREFGSIMIVTNQGDCIALAYNAESRTLGFTRFFDATEGTQMVDYASMSTPDYNDIGVGVFKLPNGSMQYVTFSEDLLLGFIDPVWHTEEYLTKFKYLDKFYSIFELYSDTVVGLSRYDVGETVQIYATDGTATTKYEITADGTDTYVLPQSYQSVAVGTLIEFEIATMPIEAGQAYATAQTGMKRVDQALIRTADASEVKVGSDGYNYDLVPIKDNKAIFEMPGSTELDHIIYIRHDSEGPCMINNIALRGVNNDG